MLDSSFWPLLIVAVDESSRQYSKQCMSTRYIADLCILHQSPELGWGCTIFLLNGSEEIQHLFVKVTLGMPEDVINAGITDQFVSRTCHLLPLLRFQPISNMNKLIVEVLDCRICLSGITGRYVKSTLVVCGQVSTKYSQNSMPERTDSSQHYMLHSAKCLYENQPRIVSVR